MMIPSLSKKRNWKELSQAFVPHNRGTSESLPLPLLFGSFQKAFHTYGIDIHRWALFPLSNN
jgi:hypothetical protein